MKIKARSAAIKSMKLAIPFDGIVEIDAHGVVEVSANAAKALVEGTNDWDVLEEGNAPQVNSNEKNNGENDAESDEVINGIKKMTLAQMIEMAQQAGYPEEDWGKFAKKDKLMAAYLIKQYNDAKNAAE